MLSQCDASATDDGDNNDDDEIMIKSNRIELLVVGAIIATFAVILLLALCLLVTLTNRFARDTVVYEYEHTPPAAVRSRAGVEDVPHNQVGN